MKIVPYGKSAALVQFEQKIDQEIHNKVVALTFFAESINGVNYCIPAYCSITIVFHIAQIDFTKLKNLLSEFNINNLTSEEKESRFFKIPVCYGGIYGPDLLELANENNLEPTEVINLHTEKAYDIYMMGFIPGFPYLGSLSPKLKCKRKETPRAKVPAGSVGLAGMQTGIYPSDAPGGWQIIGKAAIPIFQPAKADPFLLEMGDTVQFYQVDESEYMEINEQHASGELTNEDFYG